MPGPSNYPGGFANGITIRGVPLHVLHPGKVFWVNNSSVLAPGGIGGSNSNDGTYQRPFSTIDYAIGKCTADRGDIIVVMPGHAETLTTATGLVMDVAGIAIVGLGRGSKRPTLTFATNTTANIPITAANMSVYNILFRANVADVVSVFTATGTATPTDFVVSNCEFRDLSSILNFITIVTGNATANSMDGLVFEKNDVNGLAATAATTILVMAAAVRRMTVKDNFAVHPALNDTAQLLAMGANNVLSLKMSGNVMWRPSTSSTGGAVVSSSSTASTGVVHDNRFWHLDNSAGIWIATGTTLGFFENYSPITAAADKSGLINPAAV